MFIKSLMTFSTQSHPVIKISFIFFAYIRPMILSWFKFIISTMFTFFWGSQPFSNPCMQSKIIDFISFPVPNIAKSIKITKRNLTTFNTTKLSMACWNTIKFFFTDFAYYLYLFFTIFHTTFNRTINTSIRSCFKRFGTDFAYFYNHNWSIS